MRKRFSTPRFTRQILVRHVILKKILLLSQRLPNRSRHIVARRSIFQSNVPVSQRNFLIF